MEAVYLETTFISYLVALHVRDLEETDDEMMIPLLPPSGRSAKIWPWRSTTTFTQFLRLASRGRVGRPAGEAVSNTTAEPSDAPERRFGRLGGWH